MPPFSDVQIVSGSHLPREALWALSAVAAIALVLSAIPVVRRTGGRRAAALLALRAGVIAACFAVVWQPTVEIAEIDRVPNHVVVLLDRSRSMAVTPPDRDAPRWRRAARLLDDAAPLFARWQDEGHRVDLLGFAAGVTTLDDRHTPPEGEASRIGEALSEVAARYAGRDVGAVILISDGIDTGRLGRGPLDGETRKALSQLGAPVHAVLMGEPALRDLSVAAVLADDFAFVRTPVKLEAVVRASGLAGRDVDVTLLREGRPVDVKTVRLDGHDVEKRVSFDFTPDHPGPIAFEIATPVLGGEGLASNNRRPFVLKVIRDRVRILHVCGRPSWDQRFLRALLRRDPNVDLVSFFILRTLGDEQPFERSALSLIPFPYREIFDEQLASFDLVIFQNFNYQPYQVAPYLQKIRDYVEAGGALAMVGGDLSFAGGDYGQSALADVLPVTLTGVGAAEAFTGGPFRPRVTSEGVRHPITASRPDAEAIRAHWARLPPLDGLNRVAGLAPDAVALLTHPQEATRTGVPAPVVAAREVGRGRTLAILTDSAWHWSLPAAGAGDDGRAFQLFWESAVKWLVRDPALTILRVTLDRGDYGPGDTIRARVRATRPDFSPAANVDVALAVRDVAQPAEAPPLRTVAARTDGDGVAHVTLDELPPGTHALEARATIDGRALSHRELFIVSGISREGAEIVARDDVLRALAEETGGRFGTELGDPPVRPVREVRVGVARVAPVWSHPLALLLVVALLGAEWALRRRAGHA